MELEAGCVMWSIRRLRRYSFGVYFLVFTDHQCLQQICKIGETKPRIQRWMEFLSAYDFRLSYRRGQENADADFLSRLPLPPIDEDISGASALTDPDYLGVYLIRACGFTTPACRILGVGLGGLTPSPCHAPDAVLGGLTPPPGSPVLSGLHLTIDDFQTHRASMPPTHMTARPRRLYATPPLRRPTQPTLSAPATMPPGPHDAHEAKPRSWMAMPHRVRTIARPPTVSSPRPPLQRLLRSARRHVRARPA